MRTIILYWLTLHFTLLCHGQEKAALSIEDAAHIRQNLADFEKGSRTLQQINTADGPDAFWKLIKFHQSYSNELTVKMQLPVARSYLMNNQPIVAIELSQKYLNVYSNDARGWDVLGTANFLIGSNAAALVAITNAVRCGSDKNVLALGGLALEAGNKDLLDKLVIPRLLLLRHTEPEEKIRLEMINFLVVYSTDSKQRELYLQALKGVSADLIKSDPTTTKHVIQGHKLFKTTETESLYKELIK